MRAAIVGIAGPSLLGEEAALFRAHPPAGVILFSRNIGDPAQLAALISQLRSVLAPDAVLMVDQEGGRVARLRPPHWRAHSPAAAIGRRYDRAPEQALRAAWLTGALIGLDCAAAGFDVAAAPVLDLAVPGAHVAIGDRAASPDPEAVGQIGRAVAAGLMAAGVQPVGKHAPGHGRAVVDSHLSLPRVEERDLTADLHPFILNADLPWLMTAHIVYPAFDPDRPATLSPVVIGSVIRGRIGFEGVLVTDDLAMHALTGAPADRALQALAAGCDIALYCARDQPATADLLARCPDLTDLAIQRVARARGAVASRRVPLNGPALAAERDGLLA
jgi:beta-N-acetylhexosaminidase